jgi:hypothetical protein
MHWGHSSVVCIQMTAAESKTEVIWLLSPSSPEHCSTHRRHADDCQSGHCVCYQSTGLLQFRIGRDCRSNIASLQRVQNTAARMICALGPRDHVTPWLCELLEQHIIFKHCTSIATCTWSFIFKLASHADSRHRTSFSTLSCKYSTLPVTRLKTSERFFSFAGHAA